MAEELKIRIENYKEVEKRLIRLGAEFYEELDVIDTYFNQPKGKVLKITEDSKGNFLVRLIARNGKFVITKYEKTRNVNKLKDELMEKLGVKCVLKKKRRFFKFLGASYRININLIDDLGEFLILEGENLDSAILIKKLKIKKPEFVTVSFDELKVNPQ